MTSGIFLIWVDIFCELYELNPRIGTSRILFPLVSPQSGLLYLAIIGILQKADIQLQNSDPININLCIFLNDSTHRDSKTLPLVIFSTTRQFSAKVLLTTNDLYQSKLSILMFQSICCRSIYINNTLLSILSFFSVACH